MPSGCLLTWVNAVVNSHEESLKKQESLAGSPRSDTAFQAFRKIYDPTRRIYNTILVWAGGWIYGPSLSLRPLGWMFVFSVALLLAYFSYVGLQGRFQTALLEKTLKADVLSATCAEIPALDQGRCAAAGKDSPRQPLGNELIWNILLDAGIIRAENISSPAELQAAAAGDAALKNTYEVLTSSDRRAETGLQFLVGLSRGMCLDGATNDDGYDRAIGYYVAGLYPGTTRVPDLADSKTPLTLLRFRQPTSVSDSEIASAMLRRSKASLGDGYRIYASERDANGNVVADELRYCREAFAGGRDDDASAVDIWQAHNQLEKLLLWGIGQIRTTSEYRAARFNLTLITGPEQFAIFFVGWFALTLSFIRLWTAGRMVSISRRMIESGAFDVRKPDDIMDLLVRTAKAVRSQSPSGRGYWKEQILDQVASARWPMRLAISILPAIGFIGTVRGIMNSLTGADTIVWATTSAERAQAISALSADLGLAFATTMLALAFGILLSIVAAIEIRAFERAILPLFGAYAFNDRPPEGDPGS